jgi:hypothetical protein
MIRLMRYRLHRLWRWFQARFRLNLQVVCEESALMDLCDYHDYHDSLEGYPQHFDVLVCQRCGKRFII